jgi:hypothetical protein
VTGDEECPSTGSNPYCDQVGSNYRGVCHDRKDYSESTDLYPCNDGTEKKCWQDCKDATKKDDDKTKVIQKTTVIHSASTAATANPVDVSNCKLNGSTDGIQQKFDTTKYQVCGLYLNGQKAYSDGFVMGCTQIGNTQLICQSLVDSSILNAESQQTQTSTMPRDCDSWSSDLDARLAVLSTTSANLDHMLLNGETDKYDTEVDKYNAEVDVITPEVDRYNAECAA